MGLEAAVDGSMPKSVRAARRRQCSRPCFDFLFNKDTERVGMEWNGIGSWKRLGGSKDNTNNSYITHKYEIYIMRIS